MNLEKLPEQFDKWQNDQRSPYEEKYFEFLDEAMEGEDIQDILLEIIYHCVETRRQLKDYIEGNNPGMYD